MPQVEIPIDEIPSGENGSLTSSAGTVASQSLSSDGSRPSSSANMRPSSTANFNNMVMPSTQSHPLQTHTANLIDALVSGAHLNRIAFSFLFICIE